MNFLPLSYQIQHNQCGLSFCRDRQQTIHLSQCLSNGPPTFVACLHISHGKWKLQDPLENENKNNNLKKKLDIEEVVVKMPDLAIWPLPIFICVVPFLPAMNQDTWSILISQFPKTFAINLTLTELTFHKNKKKISRKVFFFCMQEK